MKETTKRALYTEIDSILNKHLENKILIENLLNKLYEATVAIVDIGEANNKIRLYNNSNPLGIELKE